MNDDIRQDIIEADEEYTIVNKTINDILNDIDFEDEEEKLLCESIINNIEKTAASAIRDMKVVQIPFIGCIRINPVKRQIRDSYKNFRIARKNMTKEQYKDHVRSYVIDIKEKQEEADRLKIVFHRIRRNNKSKYETFYKNLGRAYAELFIMSIYWLKEVPFDAEFEEHYQSLKT